MAIKDFLKYILDNIAQYPEDVVVEEYQQSNKKMFYIQCNRNDKSRVIGKGGKTISSIQQVVYASIRKDLVEGEVAGDLVRLSVEGKSPEER